MKEELIDKTLHFHQRTERAEAVCRAAGVFEAAFSRTPSWNQECHEAFTMLNVALSAWRAGLPQHLKASS